MDKILSIDNFDKVTSYAPSETTNSINTVGFKSGFKRKPSSKKGIGRYSYETIKRNHDYKSVDDG